MPKIDIETLKSKTDLLQLAERDTTLKRVSTSGGGEYAGACPFCGGHDRFRVQPRTARWLCRHCTESKWQDAINYVMRRDGCNFVKACEALGAGEVRTMPTRITPPPLPQTIPPAKEWQTAAHEVIETCAATLWSATGDRARSYLHRRGLTDETIKYWQLGYLPGGADEWRRVAGLQVPCGIVIPCEIDGVVWYLKTRRATGEPKYMQVKGGKGNSLFAAQTLRGKRAAVLCEGEFDAMLLAQDAGDLVGVATLGSASGRLDVSAWGAYLLPVARLLVAYDTDAAGGNGANHLAELTERARCVQVPIGKDVTEYRQQGGNLREWISGELVKHGGQSNQTLPAWVTDTLGDCGLLVGLAKGGARWVALHSGQPLFDRLTSKAEPTEPTAKEDHVWHIAAAAIREGRYGKDYTMPSAEGWREWAAKFETSITNQAEVNQ